MSDQKQLFSLFTKLQSLSSEKNFTSHELSNLIHDLDEVKTLLEGGHYQHSDYLSRNTYDVPRRTQEFFLYMKGYQQVAETWIHVLKPLISKDTQHVLDLCPGWAPKIELALHMLDFKGTVYLWDVDSASTQLVLDYMKLFKPKYNLTPVESDLFLNNFNKKSDLIVANHIIDDLLLYEYCKENHRSMKSLYESEQKMLDAIKDIMIDQEIQKMISSKLVRVVEKNLAFGGCFVVSQYSGLFETANNLIEWVYFCKAILNLIKESLMKKNYFDVTNSIEDSFLKSKDTFFTNSELVCLRRLKKNLEG